MAKVNLERKNPRKKVKIEYLKPGEVFTREDALFVATDLLEEDTRLAISLGSQTFGYIDYIERGEVVEVLEDTEITIKY